MASVQSKFRNSFINTEASKQSVFILVRHLSLVKSHWRCVSSGEQWLSKPSLGYEPQRSRWGARLQIQICLCTVLHLQESSYVVFNLHLFSTHSATQSCYPPLLLPSSATRVRYLSLLTHTGFRSVVRPLSPAMESRDDRVINWFATQWHCCGFLPLRLCVCMRVCLVSWKLSLFAFPKRPAQKSD